MNRARLSFVVSAGPFVLTNLALFYLLLLLFMTRAAVTNYLLWLLIIAALMHYNILKVDWSTVTVRQEVVE